MHYKIRYIFIEDLADLYAYQRVYLSTIMQTHCSSLALHIGPNTVKYFSMHYSLKFASSPTAVKCNSYMLIFKYILNCFAGLRPTFFLTMKACFGNWSYPKYVPRVRERQQLEGPQTSGSGLERPTKELWPKTSCCLKYSIQTITNSSTKKDDITAVEVLEYHL